jgi:hypothetical protein
MRVGIRLSAVITMLVVALAMASVYARAAGVAGVDPVLKQRVERRFEVLPVQGGAVLKPKRTTAVRVIEIRGGAIDVDGVPATGALLREKLGADADLVLQVSYLPADVLASWYAPPPTPPSPPASPVSPQPAPSPEVAPPPAAPSEPAREERDKDGDNEHDDEHWRRSAARVNIGGDITVEADERVSDPVVAVGGSVTVLGHVDDDVVAVGGSVRLGPRAVVRGDVTSVGGRIEQAPGATIRGNVNEIRFGSPNFQIHPGVFLGSLAGWDMFSGWFRLLGTLLRLGIVLMLVFLAMLVAPHVVERIGERAARDPWLSGFTGLLAQLLFVPVLVLTVVVLAVSIIGIPLLVLVPFGIVALLLAVFIGFAGVVLRIGRWAAGADRPVFVALAVGVVLVAAVGLIARTLGLVPAPLWPITWFLGVVGFFAEYIAWTVGLGAALLTRFGTRGPRPITPTTNGYPPPLPTMGGPSEA